MFYSVKEQKSWYFKSTLLEDVFLEIPHITIEVEYGSVESC
jgi:hypothetical protein